VGSEHGRVIDERVAQWHNVLGQETTDPADSVWRCGYLTLIDVATRAGLPGKRGVSISQSGQPGRRRYVRFRRPWASATARIQEQHEAARYLGVSVDEVKVEVFGLNHLRGCGEQW
jgi:hypothetical protein